MATLRDRLTRALPPVLLALGWLLSFFAPLLPPGRALANRDIGLFHLPLRLTFRNLAAFGLPTWSPWLHGGQPILSNPNYGAFYPPSWLVFAVPTHYALSLLAMAHAAVAFAGAWRLARRLGCGRGAAALAGIGYTGCGAYMSLLSALTLLWSLAWLPWLLAWTDEALRAGRGERWWRPALLAGGALGLQLLNGEPSTVVMSGLALLALTVSAAGRRPAVALRVLVPFAFGVAVAAVQLLPTLARIADSPRKSLPADQALIWSMRPERLAEVVFPRFFGDPTRELEGRFFGWKINDRGHPYVESFYPGLLLAVLGLAALLRGRIPRRSAWALGVFGGIFLALGKYNPLYEGLRRTVPVLGVLRFPEKFIVLADAVAGGGRGPRLAAAARRARRAGARRPPTCRSPWRWWCWRWPRRSPSAAAGARRRAWLIASQGAPDLDLRGRATALEYLRGESWAALATAAAVVGLLPSAAGGGRRAGFCQLSPCCCWPPTSGTTATPCRGRSRPPSTSAAAARRRAASRRATGSSCRTPWAGRSTGCRAAATPGR